MMFYDESTPPVQVAVFASIVPDQNFLLASPHFILLPEFEDSHSIKFIAVAM